MGILTFHINQTTTKYIMDLYLGDEFNVLMVTFFYSTEGEPKHKYKEN